jgi:hypothetical protein
MAWEGLVETQVNADNTQVNGVLEHFSLYGPAYVKEKTVKNPPVEPPVLQPYPKPISVQMIEKPRGTTTEDEKERNKAWIAAAVLVPLFLLACAAAAYHMYQKRHNAAKSFSIVSSTGADATAIMGFGDGDAPGSIAAPPPLVSIDSASLVGFVGDCWNCTAPIKAHWSRLMYFSPPPSSLSFSYILSFIRFVCLSSPSYYAVFCKEIHQRRLWRLSL